MLFHSQIISFYNDNGGEFLKLKSIFKQHGITHFLTPPHIPKHNGYAKRRHRHIREIGLALLSNAGLPKTYWSHSFDISLYLINQLSTPLST